MNYTSTPLRQGLKLLQSHSHCKFYEVKITFKCRRESHKLLFEVKGTQSFLKILRSIYWQILGIFSNYSRSICYSVWSIKPEVNFSRILLSACTYYGQLISTVYKFFTFYSMYLCILLNVVYF